MIYKDLSIPYIIITLFIAFLLVILLSVVIFFARILIYRIIDAAENKLVRRGGDNAKGVIRLYRCENLINSFLSFFQCCAIGPGYRATVRSYLPKAKKKKITIRGLMIWIEITIIFFLLLNPYYIELISGRIPQINIDLLGDLAVTVKAYLTVVVAAAPVVISGIVKSVKWLSSRGDMKKAVIKEAQKDDCAKLIEAHKRIKGILSQIEEDESYEIEEMMRSIKSQPSFYIRETIEEKIPSLSFSYSANKFMSRKDVEFGLGQTPKALTMHTKDISERKLRLKEGINEIRKIIELYNSDDRLFKLRDIRKLDGKTGRAYARIELGLKRGLTDCISRADIIEQTNNRIKDDLINLLSERELVDHSNRVLDEMQESLFRELKDGIELLVDLRKYTNAFERMYELSK